MTRKALSSLKRIAWFVTALGAALFVAAFIYFSFFSETANKFSSTYRYNDRHNVYVSESAQTGAVELVGLLALGIGVVLLICVYTVFSASVTEPPPLPGGEEK